MNIIVIYRTKLITRLTFLIGVIPLAFFSGWSDEGFDRENYLIMYKGVVSNDDIAISFLYAKDITFLLFCNLANYYSPDAKLAFFLICFTSVAAKYFAVNRIAPRHLLSFLILYAIFLSPGLEFAAMRGGLAIGFFILALAYSERLFLFIVFSLLCVASHMTLLLAVLLAYHPVNKMLARHKIGYVAIALLMLLMSNQFVFLFPHGDDYEGNTGTLLAYAMPIATHIISQFVFFGFKETPSVQQKVLASQFLSVSKPVIYGLIAIAYGVVSTVVTASTRYLEITWCLLLLSALILYKKSFVNFVGLVALICFLSYVNNARSTWLAIINPELF
jgi:hypothetical protein